MKMHFEIPHVPHEASTDAVDKLVARITASIDSGTPLTSEDFKEMKEMENHLEDIREVAPQEVQRALALLREARMRGIEGHKNVA